MAKISNLFRLISSMSKNFLHYTLFLLQLLSRVGAGGASLILQIKTSHFCRVILAWKESYCDLFWTRIDTIFIIYLWYFYLCYLFFWEFSPEEFLDHCPIFKPYSIRLYTDRFRIACNIFSDLKLNLVCHLLHRRYIKWICLISILIMYIPILMSGPLLLYLNNGP